MILNLSGTILEEEPLFNFFRPKNITLKEIILAIEKAKDDKNIDGIIIKVGHNSLGLGQIEEIKNSLENFKKKSNKKVFMFLTASTDKEYYLALSGDKIFGSNNESFDVKGFNFEITFYKGILTRLGIKPESFTAGKYKSVNMVFTDLSIPKEIRDNFKSILNDIYKRYEEEIFKKRKIDKIKIKEIIDNGPYTTNMAKTLNLIDGICYEDEILAFYDQKFSSLDYKTNFHSNFLLDGKSYANIKKFKYNYKVNKKIAVIR
jgi:protease-4